jgi:hypothetical protein
MEIYLAHRSALEYLRLQGKSRAHPPSRKRCTPLPTTTENLSAVRQLIHTRLSSLTKPLEIMVGSPDARRPSSHINPHVFSTPVPDYSFVDLGQGLYVSTPEFCFTQMAKNLKFSHHTRWEYEAELNEISLPM